jgi:hypothetical protein
MRVPAGALKEAACSVDLAFPPSASRRRWRVARSVRCVADLCPALPGYHLRALVVWDVRGEEVGLSTRRPRAGRPPSAPFSRLLPPRACISLPSVCPSLPLFCARRAPAKMLRNAEISNISRGPQSMCNLKNLIGPRHAQTAAEKCRGVGAFVCGAWFRFGTDYVQNASL